MDSLMGISPATPLPLRLSSPSEYSVLPVQETGLKLLTGVGDITASRFGRVLLSPRPLPLRISAAAWRPFVTSSCLATPFAGATIDPCLDVPHARLWGSYA